MITVEVSVNGKAAKTLEFEKPLTVKQALADDPITINHHLYYLLNREPARPDTTINKPGKLDIITITSQDGHRIYQDTLVFLMMKAFFHLYPREAKLVVEHTISDGVYLEVFGYRPPTPDDAARIEAEMQDLVNKNLAIHKEQITYDEAKPIFEEEGRNDLIRNLQFVQFSLDNIYRCGQYYDYVIRPLAHSSGVLDSFKVEYHKPGFILRHPRLGSTEVSDTPVDHEKLFAIHQEYDKWLNILRSHNVADLNNFIANYDVLRLIQVEEALQEKKLVNFAEYIRERNARLVLIAGPSSSGKTTFAKRLSIQLAVNGLIPVIVGLDDYFLPRAQTPLDENGERDYECIDALDLPLLNEHLTTLLDGGEVALPRYNFVTGERDKPHHSIKLEKNQVLVMEGIHGLNERLTPSVPREQKVKIYISCLNQLNIDRHNRIPTTDFRKLRRMSRDYLYRGYSPEDTLMRWPSVRAGEEKHIFPFQEEADFMFNSGLTYEMAVLKKYVLPLLKKVPVFSPVHQECQRLINLLNHTMDIADDQVPTNSILREFTKGSVFTY